MPGPTVDQQVATAKQQMQQEYPGRMAGTSIQPMGWMGKALSGLQSQLVGGGQTQALTNPWTGSISYNPEALAGQDQNTINQMLAHELTHTAQAQQAAQQPWYQRAYQAMKGLMTPGGDYPISPGMDIPQNYQPRSDELEAFQTENDRALAQQLPQSGDIMLFPQRRQ